jgi:hypothetical protein
MMLENAPQISVDIYRPQPDGRTVATLLVRYSGSREARIELPPAREMYERQPGSEVFRQELIELMGALDAWLKAGGSVRV